MTVMFGGFFQKRVQSLTPQQRAEGLWAFCGASSETFYEKVLNLYNSSPFKVSDESGRISFLEVLVLHLWMVSKMLGEDKEALDYLHDLFFKDTLARAKSVLTEQQKSARLTDVRNVLVKRYGQYYEAFEKDKNNAEKDNLTLHLSAAAVKNIFEKPEPILGPQNTLAQSAVHSVIGQTMLNVKDFNHHMIAKK